MWLDKPMYIDNHLIAQIAKFPIEREYPTLLFKNKKHDKTIVENMKEKYDTH